MLSETESFEGRPVSMSMEDGMRERSMCIAEFPAVEVEQQLREAVLEILVADYFSFICYFI